MKKCVQCGRLYSEYQSVCSRCQSSNQSSSTSELVQPLTLTELAEMEQASVNKRRRQKWVTSLVAGTVLTGAGMMIYATQTADFRELKTSYEAKSLIEIEEKRQEVKTQDWEQFEQYLVEETGQWIQRYQKGKTTYKEAVDQFEFLKSISISDSTLQAIESAQVELNDLYEERETFQRIEMAIHEGRFLTAYRELLNFKPQSVDAKEAEVLQQSIQEESVRLWRIEIEELVKKGLYAEALKQLDLVMEEKPNDANLIALKAVCEKELSETNVEVDVDQNRGQVLLPDLDKNSVETSESLDLLVNATMFDWSGLSVEFKMARYAIAIKPDLIDRSEGSTQVVYESSEEEAFFDLVFRIQNETTEPLKLNPLVTGMRLYTEDGDLIEGVYAHYCTESPDRLIPYESDIWVEAGRSSTYRATFTIPKAIAMSKGVARAEVELGGVWVQLAEKNYIEPLNLP